MKNTAQTIYTIGFTKKSAEEFFQLIKTNGIKLLIDVRAANNSQLDGFSKGRDLEYFLRKICGCAYRYETLFAPPKELMKSYRALELTAEQYETAYRQLMEERSAVAYFDKHYGASGDVCLLCSEDKPDHCHRRILAEMLIKDRRGRTIKHL